jgi:ankyrin repeat and BTB/POZ domain-containing protein 1
LDVADRQFVAKNLAKDLDSILTDGDFHVLVKESASRISKQEETDTIELIDDVPLTLTDINVRSASIWDKC